MTNKEESTQRIEAQLETVIKLLAAPLVSGKNVTESIAILSKLGLDRNQIAGICDTTPATVKARIWEATRQRGSAGRPHTTETHQKGE